ncbi:methyltransferase domain-containing protein [Streptomyces sp. MST-110588]|uniref:methyltransferase domain-containing protein n=1 Tax=Streptomyces sp. MST-110588 TaxID=2833628 RepID=UPI001F5D33EB|nr:methyltransferase domain-containing protein [Streptomyces sp. MST-110588]UNO40373.1 methyltransferase domain-containing protein [Streptomyces sp. MST-110588]
MIPHLEPYKQRCTEELARCGAFPSGWLRLAFSIVPREVFTPDQVWWPEVGDDGLCPVLDLSEDPDAWARAVYDARHPLITQMDGSLTPASGPAAGRFSSSISAPAVVLGMLGHLALDGTHRVLEVGTGSGYNAALLCELVGSDLVDTVEIDGALAARARVALRAIGYHPQVHHDDGAHLPPQAGPYDRIIATASTTHVPYSWVERLDDGGAILVPRHTTTGPDGLLFLRDTRHGTVSGHFVDLVDFMPLRGQEPVTDAVAALRTSTWGEAKTTTIEADLDLSLDIGLGRDRDLGNDREHAGLFAVSMRRPDLRASRNDDGTWWLSSPDVSSWAAARQRADGTYRVKAYGPRDLVADLADAAAWWRGAGRPEVTRFGVTVDRCGETVWLDTPDNPVSAVTTLK